MSLIYYCVYDIEWPDDTRGPGAWPRKLPASTTICIPDEEQLPEPGQGEYVFRKLESFYGIAPTYYRGAPRPARLKSGKA